MKNSHSCITCILFVTASFSLLGHDHPVASGSVFHDENHNSIRDDGEKGVAGVPVSNGEEIVLTDEKGNWALSYDEETNFFVIPDRKWATPVDEYWRPVFYYLHREKNSVAQKFEGHEVTGEIPESIDFPVTPKNEDTRFSIYMFGDPQPEDEQEVGYLAQDIVQEILMDPVKRAFGISLGDIVSDDLSLFGQVSDAVSQIGIPWYRVIGNHDINYDVSVDEDSDDTFEKTFGPATYAFQHGRVHFIILDDVVFHGQEFYQKIRDGKVKKQKPYIGGLREDQFYFLENYLKLVPHDDLIVMCMHIPLFQRESPHYKGLSSFREEDRERLFGLFKNHPYTLSFSAHTHFQKQHFFTEKDGWSHAEPHLHVNMGTTSGDWFKGSLTTDGIPNTTMKDGTPNGYGIVEFEENEYSIRYKVAGAPAEKQMSLYVPRTVEKTKLGETYLWANFYMGTEKTKAFCRFGENEEWTAMTMTYDFDPRVVEAYEWEKRIIETFETQGKAKPFQLMSAPHRSTHLWKIRLPEELDPGFQWAEVKMVDRFGEEFFDKVIFNVK